MAGEGLTHVVFELEQRDGWPPHASERVWAKAMPDGLYRIENIPFYAPGVSFGDLVAAEGREGELVFSKVVKPSGNSTVQVIFFAKDRVQAVRDALRGLGCDSEVSEIDTMIAVDVPAETRYDEVFELLDGGFRRGELDYSESALRHDHPLPPDASKPRSMGLE